MTIALAITTPFGHLYQPPPDRLGRRVVPRQRMLAPDRGVSARYWSVAPLPRDEAFPPGDDHHNE
jgi:hypothetical protein